MSSNLAAGLSFYFGLFLEEKQVGFAAASEYVLIRKGRRRMLHINRVVVHPDYCGLGLGIRLFDAAASACKAKGFSVATKFSNIATFRSMEKSSNWVYANSDFITGTSKRRMSHASARNLVKWWSFRYVGE